MRAASSGDGRFRGGITFQPLIQDTDLSIILQNVDALHPLALTHFTTLLTSTRTTSRLAMPNLLFHR